jgi:hypothetical protein
MRRLTPHLPFLSLLAAVYTVCGLCWFAYGRDEPRPPRPWRFPPRPAVRRAATPPAPPPPRPAFDPRKVA